MTSRRCNPANGVPLLALVLLGRFTASYGTFIEYGRADNNTTSPETTSSQGTLQGLNLVSHHNRTFYGFKGIPYSEPPVGDLRFKAPVAAGNWNGTLNATSDSAECPQVDDDGVTIIGDEDCLHLNVYTPKLPTTENATLLPVLVFIFGGRFKAGTNAYWRYGPTFLLDKDIVLVAPNFRVGVLGYLTTGDEVSPGNYGLKDIVLALEWVQENVQYFGGDPSQVTLFGTSSGAMSVSHLTLTDSTNGLFHRMITNSGAAPNNIGVTAPVELHVNRTIQLATHFGCPTNSSTLMVNCLRGIDASELVDTVSIFYVWGSFPAIIWFPSTEPDIEGALLTDTPANLIAAGKVRDVPWISLVVETEGLATSMLFYEDADLFEDFLSNIDLVLPHFLQYSNAVDDETAFTEALKSQYLNDLNADRSLGTANIPNHNFHYVQSMGRSEDLRIENHLLSAQSGRLVRLEFKKAKLLQNLTELVGDSLFYYPAYSWMQQQLVSAKNPVYFTCFEYRGVLSATYYFSGGSTNYTYVTHADETIYIFETFANRFGPADYEYSEIDWTMVDTMVQLWTSFVINGTPTIGDSNSSVTVWEPYSSSRNYLRIGNGSNDTSLGMEYDLYGERMQFWENLMASTSGVMLNRVQLLSIVSCFFILAALYYP